MKGFNANKKEEYESWAPFYNGRKEKDEIYHRSLAFIETTFYFLARIVFPTHKN